MTAGVTALWFHGPQFWVGGGLPWAEPRLALQRKSVMHLTSAGNIKLPMSDPQPSDCSGLQVFTAGSIDLAISLSSLLPVLGYPVF